MGRRSWNTLLIGALAALAGCVEPKSVTCPSGRICPDPYTCAAKQDICIIGGCGNGIVDGTEVCDDGNVFNDDSCSSNCKSDNRCGNSIVDKTFADVSRWEVCDGGPLNGFPTHCSADCKSDGRCGNGTTDIGEQCDYCIVDDAGIVDSGGAVDGLMSGDAGPDGATVDAADNDADSGSASAADAGTGPLTCALNILESRTCNHDCTTARCGDIKVNKAAGEQCDDGRESTTCNVDCTISRCGDGKVNRTANEECDVAGAFDTANCNGIPAASFFVACHFSLCGDGYVNHAAGESCDTPGGANVMACNGMLAPPGIACHATVCGDGYVNSAAGETCDVLGGADTANCNGNLAPGGIACHAPACGDGYVNRIAGETCDVLGGADTATCNGNGAPLTLRCKAVTCGDGYINRTAGETCEVPASGADTATCNGTAAATLKCHDRSCGDGYINAGASETCDDRNMVAGDGCDSSCQKETGFTCTTPGPSVCKEICGDGRLTGRETCDDFNTSSCGTCSAACDGTQAPGRATGTITAVAGASLNNGESFTLSDGVHAAVTFEFNFNTPAQGHIPIARNGTTDAGAMAGRIANAINGVGSALAITAMASGTQVRLTNTILGSRGNVAIGTTVRASGFTISGMSDGVAYDCATGIGCGADADCASGVCCVTGTRAGAACTRNTCLASRCNDGVANGTETGVDCGGLGCAACADGLPCVIASDCTSAVCPTGVCQVPSCTDGARNGGESDVDCGSACTNKPCGDLSPCAVAADCASAVCTGGVCQAPSCTDNVKNGNETAVDCGGSCGLCTGAACTANGQCKSLVCLFPDAGATDGGGSPSLCL